MDSLGFTVKAFGCFITECHPVYADNRQSVRNVTVYKLVKELENYKLCGGLEDTELTGKIFHHVIPMDEDPLMEGEDSQLLFPNKAYSRSCLPCAWGLYRAQVLPVTLCYNWCHCCTAHASILGSSLYSGNQLQLVGYRHHF